MAKIKGPLEFPKINTTNPVFGAKSTSGPSFDGANLFSTGEPVLPGEPGTAPGQNFFDTAPQIAKTPDSQMSLAVAPLAKEGRAAPKVATTAVKPITPAITPVEQKAVKPAVVTTPTEAPPKPAPTVAETETAQAQTDLQLLNDAARDALVSQNDPISKAKFNQALSNIGLANQAQRDLLQQQINSSPDLAGQPTGTALLSMMARQQGADVSNLITSMSLESANRIRDLNKWGFDRLSAITSFKKQEAAGIRSELLQAGDFTGYANRFKEDTGIDIDVSSLKELSPATQQAIATQQDLLDAALTSGNLEKAQQHFDTIVGLAPNAFKGATFEDMGFADQSYKLKSSRNEEFDRQIRLDVAQGDIDDAINGIETRFTLEERQAGGIELFQEKTLEEINAALTAAGLDTIEDKTELIGQEQELFTAFKIADIVTQTDRTVVDNANDFLTDELQKTFGDILLDDTDKQLIRSFANDMVTGGEFQVDADGNVMIDPNELVKPWEAGSATEHNFKNWPMMDAEGNVTDASEFFTESNPEPDPDSAMGIYYADLNKKFDAYNLNTAKDERISMMAWFRATKAGTQEVDPDLIPESEKKVEGLDSEVDTRAFKADLGAMTDTEFTNEFHQDSNFRTQVLDGALLFNNNESFEGLTKDTIRKDILEGPTRGYLKIGDSVLKVDKVDDLTNKTGTGDGRQHQAVKMFTVDSKTGKKTGSEYILILDGPQKGQLVNWTGDPVNGRLEMLTVEEFIAASEQSKSKVSEAQSIPDSGIGSGVGSGIFVS